jgi:hydrogenase/urease accessory protein HupE
MRLAVTAAGLALCAAALLLVGANSTHAHELRPGYLELRQTGPETFDVLWKVPARGGERLPLHPRLPDGCEPIRSVVTHDLGNAFADRWAVRHPGGLAGGTVAIEGLERTLTDVLVRVAWSGGASQVERLTPGAPTCRIAAAPSALDTAGTYLTLGVEHILFGIDHLLFVLALLLLVDGPGRLVGAITAFTVAHSVTLGAAALGWVHVPQAPVEAAIALSVVFVATEIVHDHQGRAGITKRAPWIAAFAFGLLHGFGFAGALAEIGLPEQSIPLALLSFNLGVEFGQLAFVAAALAPITIATRLTDGRLRWLRPLPAYGIGSVAVYWLIERIAGFSLPGA